MFLNLYLLKSLYKEHLENEKGALRQIVFKKVLDTKFSKYLRKEGQDIMYVHFRGVLWNI